MTTADTAPLDLSRPEWRDHPHHLKDELLARLEGGIAIDANLPRPADTLTVQLLIAARRSAEQAGVAFTVQNVSDPFRDGLRILGLHNEILA